MSLSGSCPANVLAKLRWGNAAVTIPRYPLPPAVGFSRLLDGCRVRSRHILYTSVQAHGLHISQHGRSGGPPMPWSETSAMDQKRLFIKDYIRGSFTMAELCRRYGIARPTGYKWVDRFRDGGLSGLEERSRRPQSCSHETAIEITDAIL